MNALCHLSNYTLFVMISLITNIISCHIIILQKKNQMNFSGNWRKKYSTHLETRKKLVEAIRKTLETTNSFNIRVKSEFGRFDLMAGLHRSMTLAVGWDIKYAYTYRSASKSNMYNKATNQPSKHYMQQHSRSR